MPADTRSTRKAKNDDGGRQKEKSHSEEGSENATGSKRLTKEISSKKNDSLSPSITRKSVRLKNGNYQDPNPSPLRRSERAKSILSSGKSGKNPSLTDATQKSHKRKTESNPSSQSKKKLTAYRYRDLFRVHTTKVNASDSANGRRVVPCTSSNIGRSSKRIPVAEEDDLNKEGKCREDYAESTSNSDQGGLDSSSKEVAGETPNGQNNVKLHPGQKPWNASVEVSVTCSKRQRVDAHLPETNLFEDACENSILEVHGEGETGRVNNCQNGDVINIEENDLRLDAEMDCEETKCIICKFAGRLLYCGGKGCRKGCHPACLNSRLGDSYPGIWHCPWCTKNKIEFGVHSISEGIESIWDVRIEDIQNHEGVKRQKEYFTKFKGLAHAHNCWLPEQHLLLEAPELVSEFVRRENSVPWKQEWSEPHRLLQKRSLMLPKSELCVAHEVGTNNFQHEWLVKWCGLDYNEITWELENAVFFKTPKALDLMNEYERRHQKARRAASLQKVDEIQEEEKDFSVKLSTLPSTCDCTDFINNLHDYWSKGKNILIIDEQVQAAHIIYFILTLQSNVSRPVLVMVPSSSISNWEAEFSFVAPSVNTIVYNGNRDARKMIRTLEFHDGPRIMFEVLLSTVDIITEDLEYIKCIGWEAVIMDRCFKSETSAESIFVKELASGSMILLLMDQINENAVDYYNVLSLLDRNIGWYDVANCQVDSDSITLLREKLSPFIVCGPRSGSSRLVEYWVPVQMSNVQLEQYCSSLLTNSTALCSKNDPIGLLPEILISTRKCCDHPYVVEEKLQGRLIEGSSLAEDILDIGVEASGKLYFLDTILKKMKDQGQKVVILFKTLGGSGRDPIGDILDDYVRQRFGEDSYERVDGGGVPSRRQASVSKFNKEGRFIFLLEKRACSSSIKLSCVDAVIIFGSDWNPLNDLKALQKIKIYSKFEINVFRLYTLCTIEERVLLLSKKSIFPESTVQGIGFSTSHMLLTWGASYLFKNLDEFHDCAGSPKILPRSSILKDVVQEFISLLQKHGTHTSTKFISSARQNDGGYSTDISLLGEPCSQLKDEDQHRMFWTKLLEERQPRWRYLSLSSQRNRKRVQYYVETSETNVQIDDTVKRKKNGNTNVEPCSRIVSKDAEKEPVSGLLRTSPKKRPELSPKSGCSTASAQKIHATVLSDKLCDEQKTLHQMLKPDMENLFQILRLKEDVQQMAEQFLLYMVANQRVIREPEQMQAFQISVCWIAASIRNEKLDHVESLSLASEHLNFNCKIDEAEFAFSKLQFPMKMFLHAEGTKLQASSKDLVSGVVIQQKEIVAEGTLIHEGFENQSEKKKSKCIKKIAKSLEKLYDRQLNEEAELKKKWRERKAKLDNNIRLEAAVIRSIHSSKAVRTDKLKFLEANHGQKLKELDSEMDNSLNGMKARHQAEKKEAEKDGIRKMKEWKSWTESGLFENLQAKEEFRIEGVPVKSSSLSGNNLDEENDKVHGSADAPVPLLRAPEPHNDVAENSGSAELAAVLVDRERVTISDNGAISKSSTAIQIRNEARTFGNGGERTLDGLGVQGIQVSSAVAADEVEQIATSKNDLLSAENPTMNVLSEADANEEGTAARTEQHEEASSSTHIESMNSPSTMNPSVIQSVSNMNNEVDGVPVSQEHATSCPRLNQLNNEDVCAETSGILTGMTLNLMHSSDDSDGMPCNVSDQAVMNHPPPEPAVSLPDDLTQPCSTSCGVPENLLTESSIPCRTTEAPIQEDQRHLNRSVEASPRPSLDASSNPPLHNSSQFQGYMASRSLPSSHAASHVSQEFDPLQKEYERIRGELNQVSKNHEDMVSHLNSECDREIEEIFGQIRRKYESMVQEAEASVSQKKRELEHNEWKVVMNIKLAEAFRCKCIDHRPAPQQVASSLTQQLLESHQSDRRSISVAHQNVNHSTMPQRSTTLRPQIYVAGPAMPMIRVQQDQLLQHTSTGPGAELLMSATDQSAARSAAAPTPLPPLPEIARNFEAWNLTEFEASLDVRRRRQQGLAGASGVVCLSDDE